MAQRSEVEVELRNYNRVRNGLRALAAANPDKLDPLMASFAERERDELEHTPYPPPRAGQRYVRTFLLRNSWLVRKQKPAQYSIVNTAQRDGRPYPGYVVGRLQAWMHRGRWWQAHRETQKRVPKLTQDMAEMLAKLGAGK